MSSPHTIAAIALVAILSACSARVGPSGQGTAYTVTADSMGWASVRVDNHVPGEVLDVEAWELDTVCCNAVVWRSIAEVIVQWDGLIKARATPGAEVVFVVRWRGEI